MEVSKNDCAKKKHSAAMLYLSITIVLPILFCSMSCIGGEKLVTIDSIVDSSVLLGNTNGWISLTFSEYGWQINFEDNKKIRIRDLNNTNSYQIGTYLIVSNRVCLNIDGEQQDFYIGKRVGIGYPINYPLLLPTSFDFTNNVFKVMSEDKHKWNDFIYAPRK